MKERDTTSGNNWTEDHPVELSELINTVESAIKEHQRSQTQLRELIDQLEISIQEHNNSEQKLREILKQSENLLNEFETDSSGTAETNQPVQDRSNTEEKSLTGSEDGFSFDQKAIDEPTRDELERDTMLQGLEKLGADLNRVPNKSDIRDKTDFTPRDYVEEFGSLMSACRESTIDVENYVLADIETVSEQRDTIPAMSEYQSTGRFSQSVIKSLFGSWKAMKKELYRQRSLSGFSSSTTSYREELIYQLRDLEKRLGHLPSAGDIDDRTWVRHQDYISEFGSIEAAFEECGFDVEERILSDINQVKMELGSVPSSSQYKELGNCSYNIVNNYFGSWGAAKSEFIQKREEDKDHLPDTATEKKSSDSVETGGGDADSDILDTIVNDMSDPARSNKRKSKESDINGKLPDEELRQKDNSSKSSRILISDTFDESVVEAVNSNFESQEPPMSSQLRKRRKRAAMALKTAIDAPEPLGQEELVDQFYDDALYTSRGSFWRQDIRPVLQEVGQYDRGESGYVFPELNEE